MRAARSTSKVQQDLPCLILSLLQSLKAKQGKSEQQHKNKPKNPTKKPPKQHKTKQTPTKPHTNILTFSDLPTHHTGSQTGEKKKENGCALY